MTDAEALELCIELTLTEDQPRADQVKAMLAERPRDEVGKFCSYHRQYAALGLKPHESTPCWSDGTANDPAARLYRRMVKAGVSPYHPDPLEALKAAEAARAPHRGAVQ
jgi:hypothetical protein